MKMMDIRDPFMFMQYLQKNLPEIIGDWLFLRVLGNPFHVKIQLARYQVSYEGKWEIIYAYQDQQVSTHQSTATKASPSKCYVRMSDIDATITTSDNEPSSQLVKNEDNVIYLVNTESWTSVLYALFTPADKMQCKHMAKHTVHLYNVAYHESFGYLLVISLVICRATVMTLQFSWNLQPSASRSCIVTALEVSSLYKGKILMFMRQYAYNNNNNLVINRFNYWEKPT